jgi:hypothetical protein
VPRWSHIGRGALVAAIGIAAFAFVRSRRVEAIEPKPTSLFVGDPETLVAFEKRGLAFADVVGERARADILHAVERDIAELTANPPPNDPRRAFVPAWITRGTFELTGVVNRIDRRRFEPTGCGEARLVYRLALTNPGRVTTRLPMTVNVRIPHPKDCAAVARRWLENEDPPSFITSLGLPSEIEINYQSTHVPAYRTDMDDSAEYVMRAFAIAPGKARNDYGLAPEGLFNTPRPDADPEALVAWANAHLPEIEATTFTLPKELLAERVISVSPRGLERTQNRPWHALEGRLPPLVLRRLDEATCIGCHQTRGVAGFHLLGEDRGKATFNALAMGPSPHFAKDLRWRVRDLARAAKGEPPEPRPFASFPDGKLDSDCGLTPAFASWTCEAGLTCRDVHHGELGLCAQPGSTVPGATCEDVSFVADARFEGPIVTAKTPDPQCPAASGAMDKGAFCAPNWLGFTGGLCSERCAKVGERRGNAICAELPSAGYEADCFVSKEPIERCLSRHLVTAWVASCDADHLCRPDYGCARVKNAPKGTGACVPPYFIFQARVDGPKLDR